MTRDELIGLTKEAGVGFVFPCGPAAHELDFLERLVSLATARERGACAQFVRDTSQWRSPGWVSMLCPITKEAIAAAIDARPE